VGNITTDCIVEVLIIHYMVWFIPSNESRVYASAIQQP